MKLIQLNIWGGKLGRQIIDFLQAEQPDIVCMQEVNDLEGRAGYKFFATLDEIKAGSDLDNAFMSPAYASRYMERELEYGNAIASKFPISSSRTVFTNGQYKRNFDITKDDGNIRNLQVVELDTAGTKLNLLNHHGYHIKGSKAGDDNTIKAMQTIAQTIDSLHGPVILCGDFNLAPDSQSINIINQKLTNLSIANKLRSTYNQFGTSDTVCDYIFVNNLVKVRSFKMSDEAVSDHKALILDFDI